MGLTRITCLPAVRNSFFDSELLRIVHVPDTMPSTGETEIREAVPTLTEPMVHWRDTYKRHTHYERTRKTTGAHRKGATAPGDSG